MPRLVVSVLTSLDGYYEGAGKDLSPMPEEIRRLKDGEGGDLLVFGSATTWNPLLERGLVDELIVLVGAALLGEGSKLYAGSPAGLRPVDARVLPASQLVELRYDASGVSR